MFESALARLASILFIAACPMLAAYAAAGPSAVPTIAVENVTVLTMTESGTVARGATVLIRGGRIEAIGPAQSLQGTPATLRVDGSGKWLMPALSDLHVHVENERLVRLVSSAFMGGDRLRHVAFDSEDIFLPYVAVGVLQIQNMSAMSEDIARRNDVENGRVLGPHMALAAMVDGAPSIWPLGMTRVAESPEAGRQVVRDARAEGYDFIKTYSQLGVATFNAIVAEAAAHSMKALGHIPARGEGLTAQLLQPGFGMVAHAEEFAYQSKSMSDEDIRKFVKLAKRNGTWLLSTLRTNEMIAQQARDKRVLEQRPENRRVHPALYYLWIHANPYTQPAPPERIEMLDRIVDFNRRLVRAFVAAGIPVVPGTDTIIPGIVPGVALHEELVALVGAGMSPEQALTAATRTSAQWLGVAADRGTVEVGKRADLLMLDADPRADINNTRKIAAVLANGRYLTRAELDSRLEKLAARYAAMPTPYAAAAKPSP